MNKVWIMSIFSLEIWVGMDYIYTDNEDGPMPKSFPSREIKKRLEADGWTVRRIRGDHHQFRHSIKPGLVTLTHPIKDLSTANLRSIFRQAGWDWPPKG